MLATKRVSSSRSTAGSLPASSRCLSARVALTSWDSSRHSNQLQCVQPSSNVAVGPGRKAVTMMGNKGAGGIFSPLVVVVRNAMGEKDFNKFRGKAISVHSQVIKDFCKQIGVENKQVQGVIRLAKKNGEWLGFLA